jgi:peptidoglycan/xylan/chitin deacetylase (PgdA/CDA1 family)
MNLRNMLRKNVLLVISVFLSGIFAFYGYVSEAEGASDGSATVPILLYHSIPDQGFPGNRYEVPAVHFEQQMRRLREWGYETISIQQLVQSLYTGGSLPRRPVVISFDDGYQDVLDNAYPIMKRFGFTGTVYIVANRLDSNGFLNKEALKYLLEEGWEVGSHGMTHTELTQNHNLVRREILQSRLDLNNALDIKVFSFAYPFGSLDAYISSKVYDYGYRAGVGVGTLVDHSAGVVYNLSRREVQGNASLEDFSALLPWKGRFVPAPYRKYSPV